MNFISWNNKQVINEQTKNYLSTDLIEESIARTLKPVMNKMKKLNIGVPYRDSRIFFFKFLQDKHPEVVPAGFETRKPSGKDVNAVVGQIAMENPEMLNSLSSEFEQYSAETTDSGLDRVSDFLNTAATLRQGKGVRPKAAEGYVRKDYSKLTAQEIADATTDAIAKKQEEFDAGDDVSDEKLLLRTAVGSVIAQLEKEDVPQEALDNVADAVAKIDTLAEFEKFLNYIADFEEYSVIYQYLVDTIDVIETNLGDIQSQKEDEEYEQEEIDKNKSDLNNDGKISEYEGARGEAIAKAMKGEKQRAGQAHSRAVADHYENEESLVGKEAILDHNRPVMVIDHDGDKFVFVQDEDGGEFKVPLSRLDFTASSENEESNIENTPLEELSILSPEEFEEVQNFENFNPNEWGYNTLQRFYFRKRKGGEDEEAEEFTTNQYMPNVPAHEQRKEEAEEVKMSPQQINQHLAVQERQRVQNLYAQQRRHTHGY